MSTFKLQCLFCWLPIADFPGVACLSYKHLTQKKDTLELVRQHHIQYNNCRLKCGTFARIAFEGLGFTLINASTFTIATLILNSMHLYSSKLNNTTWKTPCSLRLIWSECIESNLNHLISQLSLFLRELHSLLQAEYAIGTASQS